MTMRSLVEKAKSETGTLENLEEALLQCIRDGGTEALGLIIELADFDYDGSTYKRYHKVPSAIAAVSWGELGINALAERCLKTKNSTSKSVFLEVISRVVTQSLTIDSSLFPNLTDLLDLTSSKYKDKEITNCAKRNLVSVITNIDPDEKVPYVLLSLLERLNFRIEDSKVFNIVFSAISSRWFKLNTTGLQKYKSLIDDSCITEEIVHQYLAYNPQILDPFYSHIWSKPKLGEKYIADFIIKLIDDNYLVVEIEKPQDIIITKGGDLSAKANHAIRQALEYREWLISNHLYTNNDYPNIWRPNCLVVIGREDILDKKKKERLQQENESRNGIVKIVGFDWLYRRSIAVIDNIANDLERLG